MTCEEFEELSGAYVLGAVTSEERQTAQAHLATCVKCTRLAQELGAVVSVLPLSVPQVEPSPALKERLMESIQQETAPAPLRPSTRLLTRRRPAWTVRLLAVAAMLFALLAGGVTTWAIALQHQVTTLQTSNAQLSGEVSKLQEVNTSQSQQIIALRRAAQVYAMAGMGAARDASGTLLYLPQQNITLLVLRNLPKLQGTQLYQGWLLHNNRPVSIGALSIQNGIASLTFPGAISGYDSAAVSREPGPSPSLNAPAGPVVAAASLQNPS